MPSGSGSGGLDLVQQALTLVSSHLPARAAPRGYRDGAARETKHDLKVNFKCVLTS